MTTCSNNQLDENFIATRMNSFLVSLEWLNIFPFHSKSHITRHRYDHFPILPSFNSNMFKSVHMLFQSRPKKFEDMWLEDPNSQYMVKKAWNNNKDISKNKLEHNLNALHDQEVNKFGNQAR